MPPEADLYEKDGLRLFKLEAALVKVSEGFFTRNPVEAQVVLAGIRDASDLLRRLLEGGHSAIAGRHAGAFRRIGRAALFELLENEIEPSVRAVLGHWLFGYIHPYPDGNGRIARFLMNVMLASGGYPGP